MDEFRDQARGIFDKIKKILSIVLAIVCIVIVIMIVCNLGGLLELKTIGEWIGHAALSMSELVTAAVLSGIAAFTLDPVAAQSVFSTVGEGIGGLISGLGEVTGDVVGGVVDGTVNAVTGSPWVVLGLLGIAAYMLWPRDSSTKVLNRSDYLLERYVFSPDDKSAVTTQTATGTTT